MGGGISQYDVGNVHDCTAGVSNTSRLIVGLFVSSDSTIPRLLKFSTAFQEMTWLLPGPLWCSQYARAKHTDILKCLRAQVVLL